MAKCEICGGSGEDKSVLIGIFPRGVKNYGPCPACNGTGEAAELTADQAAEYLKAVAPYETWFTEQIVWAAVEYRMGKYQTLTAALNATAQAVKERGKECPTK